MSRDEAREVLNFVVAYYRGKSNVTGPKFSWMDAKEIYPDMPKRILGLNKKVGLFF